MSALAQAPSGARAGHEPGVGDSLPRSSKASNIGPGDTHSTIAPTLPAPAVIANAVPHEYLRTARKLLVAGRHTGQAQQSLEMAETRALDRSVAAGQTNVADTSPFVSQIRDARRALGTGNIAQTIKLIDAALAS
ncbi:MAG: hypothetical protein WDN25_19295 [Acetobacteraceae bacterium]